MGSLIFGGGDAAPDDRFAKPGAAAARAPARSAAPLQEKPTASSTNVTAAPASYAEAKGSRTGQSSNAFSSGSNQNCGNVITDRPSTRLHAPPGGKSSFSLG